MIIKDTFPNSGPQRRARTRSLVQLGGLMEHAGTLNVFNIPLDKDLQADPSIKNNIAALFKEFLIFNGMITSKKFDLNILAFQGFEAFKTKGMCKKRPLDKKLEKAWINGFSSGLMCYKNTSPSFKKS